MYRTAWIGTERDKVPWSQRNNGPPPRTYFICMNITTVPNTIFKCVDRIWKGRKWNISSSWKLRCTSLKETPSKLGIQYPQHVPSISKLSRTAPHDMLMPIQSNPFDSFGQCDARLHHTFYSRTVGYPFWVGTLDLNYLESYGPKKCFLWLNLKNTSLRNECPDKARSKPHKSPISFNFNSRLDKRVHV